jgi:hypothetical protein
MALNITQECWVGVRKLNLVWAQLEWRGERKKKKKESHFQGIFIFCVVLRKELKLREKTVLPGQNVSLNISIHYMTAWCHNPGDHNLTSKFNKHTLQMSNANDWLK